MYTGDRTPQNCYEDNFTHLQCDIIYNGSLILSQYIWVMDWVKALWSSWRWQSSSTSPLSFSSSSLSWFHHSYVYHHHRQPCHCCHHHHYHKHHCDYHLPTLSGSLVGFFNPVIWTQNFLQFGSLNGYFWHATSIHVHFQSWNLSWFCSTILNRKLQIREFPDQEKPFKGPPSPPFPPSSSPPPPHRHHHHC